MPGCKYISAILCFPTRGVRCPPCTLSCVNPTHHRQDIRLLEFRSNSEMFRKIPLHGISKYVRVLGVLGGHSPYSQGLGTGLSD